MFARLVDHSPHKLLAIQGFTVFRCPELTSADLVVTVNLILFEVHEFWKENTSLPPFSDNRAASTSLPGTAGRALPPQRRTRNDLLQIPPWAHLPYCLPSCTAAAALHLHPQFTFLSLSLSLSRLALLLFEDLVVKNWNCQTCRILHLYQSSLRKFFLHAQAGGVHNSPVAPLFRHSPLLLSFMTRSLVSGGAGKILVNAITQENVFLSYKSVTWRKRPPWPTMWMQDWWLTSAPPVTFHYEALCRNISG